VTLDVSDRDRIRTLTLNRPEALNAFDEQLYDDTTIALRAAADDPNVAVVVITGTGRAFSAGTDLRELEARATDPAYRPGEFGFLGLIDALSDFPKPLLVAINGLGVGIGMTIIGYADLVFMASDARLKTPFTALGVAPEAASSYLLPLLVGRQNAAWALLSSERIPAGEALAMGLVWRVCPPDDVLPTAYRHAELIAEKPIASLVAVKRAMTAPLRDQIAAARQRENDAFAELLGSAANADALGAFTKRGRAQ
jgi:enoyl-CoA hydratase/carnithine racemase